MQRLVPVPRLARDGASRAVGAHYSKCSWISVRMSRPGAGPHVGRRKNRPPCVACDRIGFNLGSACRFVVRSAHVL